MRSFVSVAYSSDFVLFSLNSLGTKKLARILTREKKKEKNTM
jgi:hypothetical protein